ncbi:malto-oligosyltrehalose synthase [Leptolyngbya sp. FACHB-541]|uniref:malto-oligosyltrehalose synthase n=1 Tax=Leptolyngbya sp. FACHB-541 TaxID=2692810 RepID=UPI0016838321|nr:malto-oligosyltrehalose synthase [Leptolyngbya sp. FACHB-541]MBD2001011.1 malto-oligosyltrehalose synthase [Leptolyngbya sp. FACHB-541]
MRIPASTYRIQFHAGFPFEAAKQIVAYLADLGISDLYASPIFKARAGSTHGYDIVDPTQINPELGTQEEFETLVDELQKHEIGWLQDIVPNHMAYDTQNKLLMDVLENGPDSESFDFFDIEWNHSYEDIRGRVLAPLLGNFYGRCLENGEIQLGYDETGLTVNYYSLKLPVRVESYARFITQNLGGLARSLGRHHPDFVKLLGILYIVKNIPTEAKGKERYDQVEFVKRLLWELYNQNQDVKEFVNSNVEFFNGQKGNSESFNPLDHLLSEQFYRLAFWKVGAEEINYRRFFTVNELISLKVEEPKVFHKTHSLIGQLVEEGKITGLRIDHIDGLYDPGQYLERLREKMGDVYITVEKILELEEDLSDIWPIEGTSGYDFMNYVNGVFCRCETEQRLQKIYTRFTESNQPYKQLVVDKKKLIIERNLAGDLENLALSLKRVAGQTRQGSDFTLNGLQRALVEVLALFPVYRTYINPQGLTESDRKQVNQVIEAAKENVPLLPNELDFIRKLLLLEYDEFLTQAQQEEWLHFVMRFQQLTGPLMAKGVEDTLLYVYSRLLSLNEVGGNPGQFGISLPAFHEFNQRRNEYWKHSMSATATHDTKRGEDMRSRLNIISEIPEEWERQAMRWSEINQSKKLQTDERVIPSANDEYFLYQTLLGAFPFDQNSDRSTFATRIKDYVIKAVREAKVHTAWLRPDSEYEEGYLKFVEQVLDPAQGNDFLQEFLPFQKRIADYGIFNSLSQVLLKNTAPGVPDLYQGTEFWDLSLVDPDNRRPVDYDQRISCLHELKTGIEKDIVSLIGNLLETRADGRIKLFLTFKVLQARKVHRTLFEQGDYQPLTVTGKFKDHVIAFARSFEGKTAIAIAPRFLTGLLEAGQLPLGEQIWADTAVELPAGLASSWKDAISDQSLQTHASLPLGEALKHFPAALMIG